MKKIGVALLALALLTGCSAQTESDASSAVLESETQASTLDQEAQDLITWKYRNDTVTPEEAALGVTAEKKASFLEEYGYETYDVAMQSLPFFLNYAQKNTPKLSDTDFSAISEKYTVETVSIPSSLDGHSIPADLIYAEDKQKDTVVLIHGLGENRRQPQDYMELFLQMGYNVFCYDQPGAGENTAPYTTYGVLEHYDTIDCVAYLDGVIGDGKVILCGKSMGGATAAMALGDEKTASAVSYAILDFPVGSFRGMVEKNTKGYCPDEYLDETMECDDAFLQHFLNIRFSMGEAADYVKDTKVPVLIFGSKADAIVPPEQEQGIYDAIQNDRKYLCMDETVGHCGLFSIKPEKYRLIVEQFLSGATPPDLNS